SFLKLLCAVLVCIIVAALQAEAAINYGLVSENLEPCVGFLENGQGPTAASCNGVKTLKNLATTTQDRRTACRCMKSAATAFPGIDPKNTAALPANVGLAFQGLLVHRQTALSKVPSNLFFPSQFYSNDYVLSILRSLTLHNKCRIFVSKTSQKIAFIQNKS
ncbi:IWF1': Non-specific lipid-transfer protein, partial [Bienertia sinuspersici]